MKFKGVEIQDKKELPKKAKIFNTNNFLIRIQNKKTKQKQIRKGVKEN
jgi:hypothetical protein